VGTATGLLPTDHTLYTYRPESECRLGDCWRIACLSRQRC
jgi:hypothetical protein